MRVTLPHLPAPVDSWSIDTRTMQPGDFFFALNDGYQHVTEALEKGAIGAVMDRRAGEEYPPSVLQVPSALEFLQDLAATARVDWAETVVGVTGSAGKTSTKDAIAHLLGAHLQVGKTEGNFNNHIGVPLSVLRLPQTSRVAVLEMGMNHAGEIRNLCRIARPDIGVVTNVGHAHVEFFDGIDGIAAAKRELIESLPPSGTAVLNADDPRVVSFSSAHRGRSLTYGFAPEADIQAEQLDATHFRCDGTTFETQISGRHAVSNILAAIAVATVFALPTASLTDAVRSLTPGKMRGERYQYNGVTIFNDSYNSNPDAVRAMLDVLRDAPAQRRIAVLGEMLELGCATEPLHRDLGREVAERGIDVLITIRGAARLMAEQALQAGMSGSAAYFFETPEEAGEFLRTFAKSGDAILFKGSRAFRWNAP